MHSTYGQEHNQPRRFQRAELCQIFGQQHIGQQQEGNGEELDEGGIVAGYVVDALVAQHDHRVEDSRRETERNAHRAECACLAFQHAADHDHAKDGGETIVQLMLDFDWVIIDGQFYDFGPGYTEEGSRNALSDLFTLLGIENWPQEVIDAYPGFF